MFGITKTKVVVDEQKIDDILNRGVENIYPSSDFLKSKLMSGERVSIYLGIDPTGKTLHLGHIIPLLKMRKFQELGHQVILLMGDFTATIGDPTDKAAARKQLTHEEVMNNLKNYKKQASAVIDFDGKNPAIIKYNSNWLAKMNFAEVLKLASLMTVDQMMKRDMFQRRNQEGKPVYIHEFMYPLMQGYDSVAMDVDGEIGGNDQTFNMLTGRDLMKVLKNKEKFVISMKLLVDSEGGKMGKTEGNMVSLDQTPEDMFGKIMSWGDDLIIPGFELVTLVAPEKLAAIRSEFENKKTNPKEQKTVLAKEIIKMCFQNQKNKEEVAEKAAQTFANTFSKGEFPEDAQIIVASKASKLSEVLVDHKLVESKSEFRRLVEAGAVSDYPDKKIIDPNEEVGNNQRKIKIGKRTFVVLKPN